MMRIYCGRNVYGEFRYGVSFGKWFFGVSLRDTTHYHDEECYEWGCTELPVETVVPPEGTTDRVLYDAVQGSVTAIKEQGLPVWELLGKNRAVKLDPKGYQIPLVK